PPAAGPCWGVVQPVGHLTVNEDGEGSNPSAPANFSLDSSPFQRCLMNLPVSSSEIAWRNSACVFMTIGPYQATGSSIGLPDTSRNRIPSSPACTTISSPLSKSTSECLLTSYTGPLSGFATCSVSTARGFEASRNMPKPANT